MAGHLEGGLLVRGKPLLLVVLAQSQELFRCQSGALGGIIPCLLLVEQSDQSLPAESLINL